MKKLITAFFFLFLSVIATSQVIVVNANTIQTGDQFTTITSKDTAQFAFDTVNKTLTVNGTNGILWTEEIVDTDTVNGQVHVIWTNQGQWTFIRNSRNRIVMLLEQPIIGQVEYRKYYWYNGR